MKKIGLIVNPIAGMGGKVALKGTDGSDILQKAIHRGAHPEAASKAQRALRQLKLTQNPFRIFTCPGAMGENICRELGVEYQVLPIRQRDSGERPSDELTTEEDTINAARQLKALSVDLLVFAGGDGTARDIYSAVGSDFPVLGIPAGVKIQSAVFALSPESAGTILAGIVDNEKINFCDREVVDLDEDAYRTGKVHATLYGVMKVPDQPVYMQNMKQSGFSSEQDQLEGAAEYIVDHMDADSYYAIGSGSCAKSVSRCLKLPFELLGIDIIRNKQLIVRDATEEQLWQYARQGKMKIIVSPIGGQGFLFGRGNHQFSPRVLKAVGKENITVMSPVEKLLSIRDKTLHIDLEDENVRESLVGYYLIVAGYAYFIPFKCR